MYGLSSLDLLVLFTYKGNSRESRISQCAAEWEIGGNRESVKTSVK